MLSCWLQKTLLEPPYGTCRNIDHDGGYRQSVCELNCLTGFLNHRCGCRFSHMTGTFTVVSVRVHVIDSWTCHQCSVVIVLLPISSLHWRLSHSLYRMMYIVYHP